MYNGMKELIKKEKELLNIELKVVKTFVKKLNCINYKAYGEKTTESIEIIKKLKILKKELTKIDKFINDKLLFDEALAYEIQYILEQISKYIFLINNRIKHIKTKEKCTLLNIEFYDDTSFNEKMTGIYENEINVLVNTLQNKRFK